MKKVLRALVGIVVLAGGIAGPPALGQAPESAPDSTKPWHDEAWTQIVTQQGVRIDYIYYPEADNVHGGIVLRLTNERRVPVRYAFTLVFRAPEAETTAVVTGRLAPGEVKTGEPAGLFWVPFKEKDRSLGEIGLRGLDIRPVQKSGSPHSHSSDGESTSETSQGGVRTKPDAPRAVHSYDVAG